MLTEIESIQELVRKLEQQYVSGTTTISEHVSFSQYDTINTIEAYLNSKFISGNSDYSGFQKPFFNICTAAANIWYRATDLDRKNIRVKAIRKKDRIGTFLITLHLQDWLRKSGFGIYLNDWGRTLARYGSAVTKFVEKDGELKVSTVPWNRLISDTVDFENNPKIERLYMTPAQLRENPNYDKEQVEELIEAQVARKTIRGQQRDNKTDYIELYEIHGKLPLSYLTDKEEDEDVYQQQMHLVSFVAGKGKNYDDFSVYKGKEKQDPYYKTDLIKEDGRAMAIGAVEHLFEAQWMTNESAYSIKKHLDIASKLIFQTSDQTFVGRNALSNIENGDILTHKANEPLTQINNGSHDITSLMNFGNQWKQLGQELTSTPDSQRGINPPSGTPLGTTQILNENSSSLFELMTENKGLALEDMFRKFVIPFLKKKMDTTDEISATLTSEQIKQIDSMYLPNEVIRRQNQEIVNGALNGRISPTIDPQEEAQKIQSELSQMGNQRFIKPSEIKTKTWKEVLKDIEWTIEIEISGESADKKAILDSLSSVFQTIAGFAGRPMTPREKLVFNRIMDESGAMTSLELSAADQEEQAQQIQAQQAQQEQMAQQAQMQTPQPVIGAVGGAKPKQPV